MNTFELVSSFGKEMSVVGGTCIEGGPFAGEHAQGVGPSMVKSNVSWVMVTRDFPPVNRRTDTTDNITFP